LRDLPLGAPGGASAVPPAFIRGAPSDTESTSLGVRTTGDEPGSGGGTAHRLAEVPAVDSVGTGPLAEELVQRVIVNVAETAGAARRRGAAAAISAIDGGFLRRASPDAAGTSGVVHADWDSAGGRGGRTSALEILAAINRRRRSCANAHTSKFSRVEFIDNRRRITGVQHWRVGSVTNTPSLAATRRGWEALGAGHRTAVANAVAGIGERDTQNDC